MLRLRPYKSSDAKYLLSWVQDERTFALWCADRFRYPLTLAQLYRYKERHEQDNRAWLMTVLDKDGRPAGHFLLCRADYAAGAVRLGFILLDPRMRGRGLGKEMMRLIIRYVFEILQMRRITLRVFGPNQSARSCYKSVGFIDERCEENLFEWQGESWSIYDMALEKHPPR